MVDVVHVNKNTCKYLAFNNDFNIMRDNKKLNFDSNYDSYFSFIKKQYIFFLSCFLFLFQYDILFIEKKSMLSFVAYFCTCLQKKK